MHFYDPVRGRVLIDAQDISELSPGSVREAIGVVPQDTALFNDTIGYNIGYGRIGSSRADVQSAARSAHVHELIETLPDKDDTQVGERGVKLSAGEKQRIAIARAVLKAPPILIFDEATSALDSDSEHVIQQELDRLSQNRTTLIIAHRLSTIVGRTRSWCWTKDALSSAARTVNYWRETECTRVSGSCSSAWMRPRQCSAKHRRG